MSSALSMDATTGGGASPLRAWLSAIRPATLSAALGPVLVGSALATADDRLRWPVALAALGGALLIQMGTNLYNDHADFEKGADTAERLGPARAVQRGWLSSRQVLRAALACLALAAATGIYLVIEGGWPLLGLGAASIASAVLYTGGPAPLAYRGLGDAFVLLFFGVVAVCGTYYAQAHELSLRALAASLAVGAFATAILVVNNLRDRHTDRRAGKRTLVVRYGERFGRVEYGALLGVAYLVTLILLIQSGSLGWLLPLATIPLALRQLARVWTRDGVALNEQLGATARLGLAFNVLLATGVML